MISSRIRTVGDPNTRNGGIVAATWLSSKAVLIKRMKDTNWNAFSKKDNVHLLLLTTNDNREVRFSLFDHWNKLNVNTGWKQWQFSPNLKYIAWAGPDGKPGYVGTVTGQRIAVWQPKHHVLQVKWLPDSDTVLILEDYPPDRFRLWRYCLSTRTSTEGIILPASQIGKFKLPPLELTNRAAFADNFIPTHNWDIETLPEPKGYYLGDRWLLDRNKPVHQHIQFALPSDLGVYQRVFSSDGEWIAWHMEPLTRARRDETRPLWISRYDGQGMRPLLSAKEGRIFTVPLGVPTTLSWVPETHTLSAMHQGQLYLIDALSPAN